MYRVSNYGRIKSYCKRKARILSPHVDKEGYLGVGLFKEYVQTNYKIHRIVAQTFIPNPEGKPQVNHIDACKMNNHVSNLAWCTCIENQNHAIQMGIRKSKDGRMLIELTDEQKEYCREVYKRFSKEFGSVKLAKKFGVDCKTILRVVTGKNY